MNKQQPLELFLYVIYPILLKLDYIAIVLSNNNYPKCLNSNYEYDRNTRDENDFVEILKNNKLMLKTSVNYGFVDKRILLFYDSEFASLYHNLLRS